MHHNLGELVGVTGVLKAALARSGISAGDVEEYMSAVWLHCLQQCVESFEPAWGALAGKGEDHGSTISTSPSSRTTAMTPVDG